MRRPDTVLALDIGGTKMLAALVREDAVIEAHTMPTPRGGDPEAWLAALFTAIVGWRGRYDTVGVAVTGIVDEGCWSPLTAGPSISPTAFRSWHRSPGFPPSTGFWRPTTRRPPPGANMPSAPARATTSSS